MIKKYNQFINESIKEEVDIICKKYGFQHWCDYTINDDGLVDVKGSVILNYKRLDEIPIGFKLVSRSFECYNNRLTTLKNSPKEVGYDFNCSDNYLLNLEGCPKKVGRDFVCNDNKLTNFKGLENTIISGSIDCRYNKIINFEGFPYGFDGDFYCDNNPIEEVYNLFYCDVKCINLINDQRVIVGKNLMVDGILDISEYLNIELPEDWKNSIKSYKLVG